METNVTAAAPSDHPVFVLVHGAWHGAWCYAHVAAALAERGYLSIARDLPAHGIHARFPASYLERPLDKDAFGAEPSPVANTTLDDYATQVMEAVDDAYALGRGKVVLVGHSMGGLAITAARNARRRRSRRSSISPRSCPRRACRASTTCARPRTRAKCWRR